MRATITLEEAERIMSAVKNRENLIIAKENWPGDSTGIVYTAKSDSFAVSVAGMYILLEEVRLADIGPDGRSERTRLYVLGRGGPVVIPIEG